MDTFFVLWRKSTRDFILPVRLWWYKRCSRLFCFLLAAPSRNCCLSQFLLNGSSTWWRPAPSLSSAGVNLTNRGHIAPGDVPWSPRYLFWLPRCCCTSRLQIKFETQLSGLL